MQKTFVSLSDNFVREMQYVRTNISDDENIDLGQDSTFVAVPSKIYLDSEFLTQKQPTKPLEWLNDINLLKVYHMNSSIPITFELQLEDYMSSIKK